MRVAVLFLIAGAITSLWGQGSVTIFGTVTDTGGAVVPNAAIKISDTLTGQVRGTSSAANGEYSASQLPVGLYSVEASAPGFKLFIEPDIRVQVRENRRVDIRLAVGDVTQSVAVSAQLAQVETHSGTISEVIDANRVRELPLNGRNALQLQLLVPGYTGLQAAAQEQNDQVSVNGSTYRSNNFTLDGADNHDPFFNTSAPLPNPDALQEFNMSTNSYPADQGRNAGMVVNAVTKSGTNRFHGTLFEFLRNKDLNARTFFASTIPPFHRNQFGGTWGGPILFPSLYNGKNKSFFFFSYQGTRERSSPNVVTSTVLTPAQRQGDFSNLKTALIDPSGGTFPGNMIPASRLSQPVQKFLNAFVPLPSGSNGLLSFNSSAAVHDNQVVAKVDHEFTAANRAYARLLYEYNANTSLTGTIPGFLTALDYTTWNFTASDIHVISPSTLNTFIFSRNDIFRHQLPLLASNHTWADFGANIQQAQVPANEYGYNTNVAGYFSAFDRIPLHQLRVAYQFSDQISLTRGSHQLRAGFELRRDNVDRSEYAGNPVLSFIARFTGNAAADFALGRISTFSQGSPNNNWNPTGNEYAAYLQDDWRVSRRLTLNLGVRWDPFVPAPDRADLGSIFEPGRQSTFFPLAPRGLVFEQDPGVPRSTIQTRWKDFGPRFGFAWDPFGDGKSSVRGGYGMFFGQDALQEYDHALGPATALSVSIDAPPGGVADPYAGFAAGFPFPYSPPQTAAQRATFKFLNPLSLTTYDPTWRNVVEQAWNISFQRQLGQSSVLTIAYVGSKGNHIEISAFRGGDNYGNPAVPGPGSIQSRRIYPDFGTIGIDSSAGNSLYHSLQVNFNKRLSHGFSVLSSYTFANLLADDLASDYIFDHSHERYRGGVKNRLVSSFVWELPRLNDKHRLLRYSAGGWEVNGIVTFQGGQYLTVTSGADNNNNGNTADRPDLVGNPFLDPGRPRAQLIAAYFNAAAFVPNKAGELGTAGRGIIQGPGAIGSDFGFFKNFSSERFRFQYRAEFFNLLNRPNFGNPNTTLASPNVGQITSTSDPRVIQMAVKLLF